MKTFFFYTLFFATSLIQAQNLSGQWQGILTQPGKRDTFQYAINISQQGQTIAGTSRSSTPDGRTEAAFTLTGFWDGTQLVLQEVEQTLPPNAGWCLKYATLRLTSDAALETLSGNWRADGCSPGQMTLRRQLTTRTVEVEKEAPFTWAGRWTGQLSQSDRDYGFFYELELPAAAGAGTSYIESEDNGGSATHQLTWTFDAQDSTFTLQESDIIRKTDPRWKWCIKTATLRLRREGGRFVLAGNWSGYIEGFTPQTGRCASGTVYLEKPVITRTFREVEREQSQAYEASEHREVRLQRVVEVQKPDIRIKVWDNGIVDGDIATLFLNGKRILNQYPVTKQKRSILVKLQANDNFLVLHADDLGDIPPNTVAVSVDDGVREQVIIMSSDLKSSGAILIRQFKVE